MAERMKFEVRFPIVAKMMANGINTPQEIAQQLNIKLDATDAFLHKARLLGLISFVNETYDIRFHKFVRHYALTERGQMYSSGGLNQEVIYDLQLNGSPSHTKERHSSSLTPTNEQSAWVRRMMAESHAPQTEFNQVVWVRGLKNIAEVKNIRTLGGVKVGQAQVRGRKLEFICVDGQWREK